MSNRIELTSSKGTISGTISECAEWLVRMQPALASVVGIDGDQLEVDVTADHWTVASATEALTGALATDEDVCLLRDEAERVGDAQQVMLCNAALDGDNFARAQCAMVLLDARAQS